MKVLVIGAGGREHAICAALGKSPKVTEIYCAPGNAGIARIAHCVAIGDTEVDELLRFAQTHSVDLTVVGPEAALAAGIADLFTQHGLRIFGASKHATRIESSKEFAKNLMMKYDIPTADYAVFADYTEAMAYVERHGTPIVIKYDGLAAGKGVVVAMTHAKAEAALHDMLMVHKFGSDRVIIEEFMQGQEFSFMCFVNGSDVYPMALAQDHKRAFEGDLGPNTGGMGAYSPLPFITAEDRDFALNRIMKPTANALVTEGCSFCGVLYGGLMKTAKGIKVIEFNARFGDPETEVVLPRLTSDIFDVFNDVLDRRMPCIEWDSRAAIGFVLASKGYPESYRKGFEIKHLDTLKGVEVFHMGTKYDGDRLLTNGGRVLFVTGLAATLAEARENVLAEIAKIDCDNLFYRSDIGYQAI